MERAEQPPGADCLQRPLVPRSRFQQRLRRSVGRDHRSRIWELKEGAIMFRRWFVGLTMVVGILTIPLLGTGSNAAEIKVLTLPMLNFSEHPWTSPAYTP